MEACIWLDNLVNWTINDLKQKDQYVRRCFEQSKKNININCISPGFIKTAMTDKIDEKFKEIILSKIPSARLGNPEDIANAVIFLASNQSDYINGETLHVNGGMYMAWQNKFLNY